MSGPTHEPEISVVVPCYNEAAGLKQLYRRICDACEDTGRPHELILVNDGSHDNTWIEIEELCRRDARTVGINLSRNFGQEAALLAGLSFCSGQLAFILDADLQDPPELLPQMLSMIDAGADVVYGRRRSRAGEGRLKRFMAWSFYGALNLVSEVPVPRNSGYFRLMRRPVLDAVRAMPERTRYLRGLVSWVGFRQEPLYFDRQPRLAGQGHWPTRRMIGLAADAFVSFSFKPLRVAFCVTGCFALATVALVTLWYVSGVHSPTNGGTMLVIAAITFCTGSQSLLLGIIGEYLGRMFNDVRGRPSYIVMDARNTKENPRRCQD